MKLKNFKMAAQQSHTFASRTKPHTSQSLQKSVPVQPQNKFQNIFSNASKKIKSLQRTLQTLTDIALNVNRFGQTVSELQTVVLRTNSTAADNIRLKEILKRRALFGNQTVVLQTNSSGNTNSGASNPFFLKLL